MLKPLILSSLSLSAGYDPRRSFILSQNVCSPARARLVKRRDAGSHVSLPPDPGKVPGKGDQKSRSADGASMAVAALRMEALSTWATWATERAAAGSFFMVISFFNHERHEIHERGSEIFGLDWGNRPSFPSPSIFVWFVYFVVLIFCLARSSPRTLPGRLRARGHGHAGREGSFHDFTPTPATRGALKHGTLPPLG